MRVPAATRTARAQPTIAARNASGSPPNQSLLSSAATSSPDGTGELADQLAGQFPLLSVLHRPKKEGLGPAYLAGFRHALGTDAELIVELDCDFSHDPADLPRLVAAVEDADLALGSRYIEGGGTRNWGLGRRAVSRFGSSADFGMRARLVRRLSRLF